jgi:hypothetical protein
MYFFRGGGQRRNQIKRSNKLIIYVGNKIFIHICEGSEILLLSFLLKINRVSIMNNEVGGNKKKELKTM